MDPLPIRAQEHPDESGHSLALRTLQKNGLTFSKAAYWLQIPWSRSMGTPNLKRWAWALQIQQDWLAQHLPISYRDADGSVTHFMGHTWQGGLRLRPQRPQVCVRCVHQNGYCKAVWDLHLACICPKHECLLSESCDVCAQPLRWNRPSVDVCNCMHTLRSRLPIQDIEPLVHRWASWLEVRLMSPSGEGEPMMAGIPSAVTPDGAFGVVMAFGMRERAHQTLPASIWRQRMQAELIYAHLSRGLSRLQHTLMTRDWRQMAPVVSEQALQLVSHNQVSSADRDFADFLLQAIFPTHAGPTHGPRRKGQLSLPFGGFQ